MTQGKAESFQVAPALTGTGILARFLAIGGAHAASTEAGRSIVLTNTLVLILFCALAGTPLALAQDAAALKSRHAALTTQLTSNHFQRPLYLEERRVHR